MLGDIVPDLTYSKKEATATNIIIVLYASRKVLAMAVERLLACTRQVSDEGLTVPDIPDDLIFNILTRLPAKSLIRFKSASKAWRSVLSGRRFLNAH